MTIITVVDNEHFGLWFHESERAVHHQIRKPVEGDAFRQMLNLGMKNLVDRKAKKWLSDDSLNIVSKPSDLEWARREWKPSMIRAGWKYWAILMPMGQVGARQMQTLIEEYRSVGVDVRTFADVPHALTWLAAMP